MSQYLILIYEDESGYAQGDEQVFTEVMAAHNEFMTKHGDVFVDGGSNALQPQSTGTMVRDGVVTDGPFIETKEALGGFYTIEVPDLDAAIAVAKDCPARFGGVEVRPVMEFG